MPHFNFLFVILSLCAHGVVDLTGVFQQIRASGLGVPALPPHE
jgi:hypothetical protein